MRWAAEEVVHGTWRVVVGPRYGGQTEGLTHSKGREGDYCYLVPSSSYTSHLHMIWNPPPLSLSLCIWLCITPPVRVAVRVLRLGVWVSWDGMDWIGFWINTNWPNPAAAAAAAAVAFHSWPYFTSFFLTVHYSTSLSLSLHFYHTYSISILLHFATIIICPIWYNPRVLIWLR